MRYYYLWINKENEIIKLADTFEKQDGILLNLKEYEKAQLYNKFNKETREFYEPKEQQAQEINRLEQIEQAVGNLAEQVAKNTLLTGGNE